MSTVINRMLEGKFVLIAEAGVNYYDIATDLGISNMDAAKLMVKKAADAGIHAIKFQTYKASTLAAKDSPSYWDTTMEPTNSQFELFKKFDGFGEAEYRELAEYAAQVGIEFCSTAFDFESADFLDPLMNIYKISSSDLSNIPFIEYQAKKGKPILLSIGASNENEIDLAVQTIRKYNDQPLVLLHCVLEYPTPYADANLNKILSLKKRYPDAIIGYSDHTCPDECYDVVKTAYTLGATVVEKHYTLNKSLKGNDHYHSMDDTDAANIIKGIAFVDSLRGNGELKVLENEANSRRNARRSVVANGDIPKGAVITKDMLTYKRPGTGISPQRADNLLGRKALADIADDTILQWDMFE